MERINSEWLDLYNYIYENYEPNAGEIFCALELLKDSLKSTREKIEESTMSGLKYGKVENFESLLDVVKRVNEFVKIETTIAEYLDCFSLKEDMDDIQDKDLDDETENEIKREIPNYKAYIVDQEKPHTLDESFSHKRVCGFFLNNKRYNVSNWAENLVKSSITVLLRGLKGNILCCIAQEKRTILNSKVQIFMYGQDIAQMTFVL
ncbi:MAG TPA: hypothetical protein DEA28_01185 [Firmicutes bacterium]|nr:hypothetical protein [Bacillota bacterium]